MMGRILFCLALVAGIVTGHFLGQIVGILVIPHILFIFAISTAGEHYVSGKGYYRYTESNGYFIGRVPLWIPLMWVAIIQYALLVGSILNSNPIITIALSGLICLTLDSLFIEPYLCKKKQLWQWTDVDSGYFSFLPHSMNRFTAPPGNYIVWLLFPLIANSGLLLLAFLLV